ncbi:hypothetical protein [Caldanaerobacter subterraneus]|uniref:hypothetical protein n=1 Tax=Caldanaerobacter subterraneus TaxID=911092 RepID=UPI001F4526AF|nr:hypothetical protein [Caldanaerobacter subterraneus]
MERVREIKGRWCFPALHESLWLSGTLIITPDNEMQLDISDFFRGSEEEIKNTEKCFLRRWSMDLRMTEILLFYTSAIKSLINFLFLHTILTLLFMWELHL